MRVIGRSIMEGADVGHVLLHASWLQHACLLGALFITIFILLP
ncbi:MAG: hypothetical protein R2794_08110 [Chitinophagales bacterium]